MRILQNFIVTRTIQDSIFEMQKTICLRWIVLVDTLAKTDRRLPAGDRSVAMATRDSVYYLILEAEISRPTKQIILSIRYIYEPLLRYGVFICSLGPICGFLYESRRCTYVCRQHNFHSSECKFVKPMQKKLNSCTYNSL